MDKTIRIGVLGTLRGGTYIDLFQRMVGAELTAVCDFRETSLETVRSRLGEGVAVFTSWEDMLESGRIDAVVLCNYFMEHVPFAVQAMERGIHVLSECTPALTMAECVLLCRTVERTGCKYMLAENYPFFPCNMEMRRIYQGGTLGKAVFCEGEYNHPASNHELNMLSPGRYHWRNWLPRSYYLTHALAPILHITGNQVRSVICKSVFGPDAFRGTARKVADLVSVMLLEMQDGSLARVTGCAAWGGHGNWYRICGEKGNVQNVPGTLEEIRLQYNAWQIPEGRQEVQTLPARWYEDDAMNALPGEAGHGGGDYWVAYEFIRYIRDGVEPFFDVYRSVSMSATAILALRSSMKDGASYTVPDFRREEERRLWEDDHASPFPDETGKASMPCCSHPDYEPSPEDLAAAEAEWRAAGLI